MAMRARLVSLMLRFLVCVVVLVGGCSEPEPEPDPFMTGREACNALWDVVPELRCEAEPYPLIVRDDLEGCLGVASVSQTWACTLHGGEPCSHLECIKNPGCVCFVPWQPVTISWDP